MTAGLCVCGLASRAEAVDFPTGEWTGSGGAGAPGGHKPPAAQPPAKPKAKPAAAAKPKKEKTAVIEDDDGSAPAPRKGGGGDGARIVIKVNDEPITAREIEQRMQILGGGDIQEKARANMQALIKSPNTAARLKAILKEVIDANEGKSKDQIIAIFEQRKKAFAQGLQKQAVANARVAGTPKSRQKAKDMLIDERLKLQEAKKSGVTINEEEVNKRIKMIAARNKMTDEQFEQHLKGMGVDVATMKATNRAEIAWVEVVRKKLGHLITVTSRDVDRLMAAGPAAEDGVEMHLQRISLQVLNKIDQQVIAKRQLEAEAARANFQGCAGSAALANSIPGARFEDLGKRVPSVVPEPTRSLLLGTPDGQMLPPLLGPTGIELWIVCSRAAVSGDKQKREAAEDEAKQADFSIRAKKYLLDLRSSAAIEDREAPGGS